MQRAKLVKQWRDAFCELAQDAMVPRLECVEICAQPYVLNGRYRQDVGNCFPSVKAAVDGLVDAGVLVDDNANVVVKLTFMVPIFGKDALGISISEVM
jgi:Holliday junction resolvase RusA-like endonuclease